MWLFPVARVKTDSLQSLRRACPNFQIPFCISAVALLRLFFRKAPSCPVSWICPKANSWADRDSTSAVVRFKLLHLSSRSFVPDEVYFSPEGSKRWWIRLCISGVSPFNREISSPILHARKFDFSEEKLKLSPSFLALLRFPVSEIFLSKNSPSRLISICQTTVRNLTFGLLSLTWYNQSWLIFSLIPNFQLKTFPQLFPK